MSTALYKALRAANVPEDLAERAADSVPPNLGELATLETRLIEQIAQSARHTQLINVVLAALIVASIKFI